MDREQLREDVAKILARRDGFPQQTYPRWDFLHPEEQQKARKKADELIAAAEPHIRADERRKVLEEVQPLLDRMRQYIICLAREDWGATDDMSDDLLLSWKFEFAMDDDGKPDDPDYPHIVDDLNLKPRPEWNNL